MLKATDKQNRTGNKRLTFGKNLIPNDDCGKLAMQQHLADCVVASKRLYCGLESKINDGKKCDKKQKHGLPSNGRKYEIADCACLQAMGDAR